ncbi:TCHP [Bugula neritina]|uniref:Trichoplein keratin filament-binding protein n=1 Tax=Bugula neritina TaxID=10212 RepID=A0A7J7JJD9_BUGNE|nr:TCHP [Bugula neritina]
MALPNMPSIYTTRKNIYEAAIVRRRTQENDLRDSWQDTARYFSNAEIHSSKDANWTSKATFQSSMDAYKKNYEKDTKSLNMARRRSKLAALYQSERNQYEAELKGFSLDNLDRLNQMKERSESLRSAREEERKQVVEERLYEHFRQNCPDIRKLESEQFKSHVVDKWSDQRDEKQLAALIKQQQEDLLRNQWEIEKLEEQRRLDEMERKKQELGRVLLRQHTAALKRRSKQVMEELEQDRKLLDSLMEKEAEEITLRTARKEKARADAAWMKEVIEDQLRLEKEREAELDMLYQDEAARLWNQREEEWNKERVARQRLMQDVLAGRQEQIQSKMAELKRQQQESLERREELVRDMERANELTQREREQTQRQKEEQMNQLHVQVSARRDQQVKGVADEIAQIESEKKAEEEYEELLRQEAERLRIQGYQPQIHSRRGKSAWQ